MKIYIVLISFFISTASFSQSRPNFKEIFKKIEKTGLISEAIEIRRTSLPLMRNLSDFDLLTNMEKIDDGVEFFDRYKIEMAQFIDQYVDQFIYPERVGDKNIFIKKIFPKALNTIYQESVAIHGLSYVQSCDEFLQYAAMTYPRLKKTYMCNYCACRGEGPVSNITVINSPFILEPGRFKTVFLGDSYYVKRIFISAEGVVQDAQFDIMVNGVIKGTIYAPGRDPSYVVTVEDYTDRLVLRSLMGKAKISQIIIEAQEY